MAKLPNVIKIGIKGNLLWDSSKNYLKMIANYASSYIDPLNALVIETCDSV